MIDFVVKKEQFNFKYLPGLAGFILRHKLEEFVTVGIRFCREADLPLLKPLSKFPEEQLVKLSMETNRAMLMALVEGLIAEHIETNARKWIDNAIGYLDKEEVLAEDLTLGFYLRRKVFAHFLDAYTKNLVEQKLLIAELDVFTTQEELISYSIFLKMQQEKLAMHKALLLETQEIAGIGSYMVDLNDMNRSFFTPEYMKIIEFDEYPSFDDLNSYIHPDDRQDVAMIRGESIANGGLFEMEFRFTKNGPEKRILSKGIVELEKGKAVRIKGILRDITQRYNMVQDLRQAKRLYKLGQELNLIGNWSWDLQSDRLLWSDEMYKLFEVEDKKQMTLGEFISLVHPDDRYKIKESIEAPSGSGEKSEYEFMVITSKGRQKLLRGISIVQFNEQGRVTQCYGSCQDMTQAYM